jgi:hypothetical protein
MTVSTPTQLQEQTDRLFDLETHPKATIIIPVEPTDPDQLRIRSRNMAKEVRDRIAALDLPIPDTIEAIPDTIRAAEPFDRSIRAIAVFADPGGCELLPLPMQAPELVEVGEQFHVTAAVAMRDTAHCHVLTITRGGCQLYRGDRWSLTPLALPGAPEALSEITWYRDLEVQLQLHATARGGGATFHGQGIAEDVELEPLRTYLRKVDDALLSAVGPNATPLLLVGPGRLPAIFREVAHAHRYLPALDIHPDGIGEQDLAGRVAAILETLAEARTRHLLEEAGAQLHSGRATADRSEILTAASEARIRTLLFDPLSPERAISRAVHGTVRNGGDAVPIAGSDAELVAILRY